MTAVTPTVRALTPDDVDAMLEVATLCEVAETGSTDPELVDWVRSGATLPSFRAYGIDGDGGLAAFGYVDCTPGHAGVEAELRVRPGLDLDLGRPLLDAVRRVAAGQAPGKPLHMFLNSAAHAQQRWLQAQGGTEIRHFWRMAIDLDETPPAVPPAPYGVALRLVRDDEDDLRMVFGVTDTAFAQHFGHTGDRTYEHWITSWRSRSGFDLSLWWIAELDGRPVAALLGSTLGAEGPDAPESGHVGTLGTLPEARGRGIGTLLLRTSFAEFHRRGLRRVTLGVDAENGTGAVRLYESVGMRAVTDWPLYELPPLP